MATAIELLQLLQAAAGEGTGSLHSALGRWRQRVGELVGGIVDGTVAAAAASKPFVQTEYDEGGPGQLLAPGTDVIFDDPGFGSIPYNPATGVFTLEANKSYQLTAHFALSTYSGETVNIGIEWVDAMTNAVLHAGHVAFCTPADNTNSVNTQPTADTFHTTTAAQGVKCRVTSLAGSATALGGLSMALVKEI